jgi:DNA-binding XRE family transcriptional regulator
LITFNKAALARLIKENEEKALKAAGTSRQQIYCYRMGKSQPSMKVLCKIADVFEVTDMNIFFNISHK